MGVEIVGEVLVSAELPVQGHPVIRIAVLTLYVACHDFRRHPHAVHLRELPHRAATARQRYLRKRAVAVGVEKLVVDAPSGVEHACGHAVVAVVVRLSQRTPAGYGLRLRHYAPESVVDVVARRAVVRHHHRQLAVAVIAVGGREFRAHHLRLAAVLVVGGDHRAAVGVGLRNRQLPAAVGVGRCAQSRARVGYRLAPACLVVGYLRVYLVRGGHQPRLAVGTVAVEYRAARVGHLAHRPRCVLSRGLGDAPRGLRNRQPAVAPFRHAARRLHCLGLPPEAVVAVHAPMLQRRSGIRQRHARQLTLGVVAARHRLPLSVEAHRPRAHLAPQRVVFRNLVRLARFSDRDLIQSVAAPAEFHGLHRPGGKRLARQPAERVVAVSGNVSAEVLLRLRVAVLVEAGICGGQPQCAGRLRQVAAAAVVGVCSAGEHAGIVGRRHLRQHVAPRVVSPPRLLFLHRPRSAGMEDACERTAGGIVGVRLLVRPLVAAARAFHRLSQRQPHVVARGGGVVLVGESGLRLQVRTVGHLFCQRVAIAVVAVAPACDGCRQLVGDGHRTDTLVLKLSAAYFNICIYGPRHVVVGLYNLVDVGIFRDGSHPGYRVRLRDFLEPAEPQPMEIELGTGIFVRYIGHLLTIRKLGGPGKQVDRGKQRHLA